MKNTPSMQELLEAGVHFGHQTRRGNPRMGEYIYGARDGVHIINLEHSEKLLREACEYAYKLGQQKKVLLFVGTKKQAQALIAEVANKVGAPYLNSRWLGGTLTNFEEIRKNVKKALDLKDKQAKGELGHYTKKEQLLISRKLEKFDKDLGGITQMDKLPDAIFLIDAVGEKTALTESRRVGIPVIAIADTNSDPFLIDYPVPGNDDAAKSIKILTEAIVNAYEEGLQEAGFTSKEEKVEKKENKKEDTQEASATEEVQLPEEVAILEQEVEKETVKDSERVV